VSGSTFFNIAMWWLQGGGGIHHLILQKLYFHCNGEVISCLDDGWPSLKDSMKRTK